MKTYSFILLSMILLLACNGDQQKNADTKEAATKNEEKTAATTAAVNALNIKIPGSTDPELNEFFKAYTAHLNEYLQAVRENNKAQMETSFQRERKFRIQLLDMPARLQKTAPAEWEKYENYREHTKNYWNEIENSDYVKQLADEAFKKNY
jgi:hypothetical protein